MIWLVLFHHSIPEAMNRGTVSGGRSCWQLFWEWPVTKEQVALWIALLECLTVRFTKPLASQFPAVPWVSLVLFHCSIILSLKPWKGEWSLETILYSDHLQHYSQSCRLLSYRPFPKKPVAGMTPEAVPPLMASRLEQWNNGTVPGKSWNGREPWGRQLCE